MCVNNISGGKGRVGAEGDIKDVHRSLESSLGMYVQEATKITKQVSFVYRNVERNSEWK